MIFPVLLIGDHNFAEGNAAFSKKIRMTLKPEFYHIPKLIISYAKQDDQDDQVLSLET